MDRTAVDWLTNTGTVTLTGPVVNETAFSGTGAVPTVVCPTGTSLSPTDTVTCDASYTVTQADVDAGSVSNTATATATPPTGVTAPSSATVAATAVPGLTAVKSSDLATITKAGQKVTYTFLVTNTGNVTVSNIAIDEGPFSGTGTLPAAVCPQPSLAPGANATCTAVYTVTQADVDAGSITNSATAIGTPPGSIVTVPSDSSTVTVPEPAAPAATVVKTSDMTTVSHAGQVIQYSVTVTNTGNTSLSDPRVNEGAFTGHGTVTVPVCPTTPAAAAAQAEHRLHRQLHGGPRGSDRSAVEQHRHGERDPARR